LFNSQYLSPQKGNKGKKAHNPGRQLKKVGEKKWKVRVSARYRRGTERRKGKKG